MNINKLMSRMVVPQRPVSVISLSSVLMSVLVLSDTVTVAVASGVEVLWYRLAVKKVGSVTSRILDSELNLAGGF